MPTPNLVTKHSLNKTPCKKSPAAYNQQWLWLHQQKFPKETFYNIVMPFRIEGNIHVTLLEKALNEILYAHDTLRSSFSEEDGKLVQTIYPYQIFNLPFFDLRTLNMDREKSVKTFIKREFSTPINLKKSLLFNAKLYQIENNIYYLVLSAHHIIIDGWSWNLILKQITENYFCYSQNIPINREKSEFQYTDYVKWQRENYQNNNQDAAIHFWKKHLNDLPVLAFSQLENKISEGTEKKGKKIVRTLPHSLTTKLLHVCEKEMLTPFMYTIAVFQLLIFVYTKQNQFGIVTPMANRQSKTNQLIGYFLNNVIIPVDVNENDSFMDFLNKIKNFLFDVFELGNFPFELVSEHVDSMKKNGIAPFFKVMFIYQNFIHPKEKISSTGFSITYEETDNPSIPFEFIFEIQENSFHSLFLNLRYRADIYTDAFINEFLLNYQLLLEYSLEETHLSLRTLIQNLNPHIQQYSSFKKNPISVKKEMPLPPVTDLEKTLALIWSKTLEIPNVSTNISFFHMGGNSLLGLKLIAQLRDKLALHFELKELFQYSTIQLLSQYIEKEKQIKSKHLPVLTKIPKNEQYLLSFTQQRLWFLSLLNPDSVAYNIAGYLLLEGKLNIGHLETAINCIIQRHISFQLSVLTKEGEPYLQINPIKKFDLPVIELDENENFDTVKSLMENQAKVAINLNTTTQYRFILYTYSKNSYALFLCMHHFIFDGWSAGIFFEELSHYYTACLKKNALTPPQIDFNYLDYTTWQRTQLSRVIEPELHYWVEKLKDLEYLNLPLDKKRPPQQNYKGKKENLIIDKSMLLPLKKLSRNNELTLFHILLSAFFILLHRFSYQNDIAINIPFAGRTHVAFEKIMGLFVSSLIIRTQIDSQHHFLLFAQLVKTTVLEALENANVPFEMLVDKLLKSRDISLNPLVQVAFNYVETIQSEPIFPELTASIHTLDQGGSKYDLSLMIIDKKNYLICELEYDTAIFYSSTIKDLLKRYFAILASIGEYPENQLFELGEAIFLTHKKNNCDIFMDTSLLDFFERQVTSNPNGIACWTEVHALTYEQLHIISNQFSQFLKKSIKNPSAKIGILVPHDETMYIVVLSLLKASLTYVPFSNHLPKNWIENLIHQGHISHIICTDHTYSSLPENTLIDIINFDQIKNGLFEFDDKSTTLNSDSCWNLFPFKPVYTLFTSGSTGDPKPITAIQSHIIKHITNYIETLNITKFDRLLQLASFGHDAAVIDMFSGLLSGATLYPVSLNERGVSTVYQTIQEKKITLYHSTPTVFRSLFFHLKPNEVDLSSIRAVILGGEAVFHQDAECFNRLFPITCRLINLYGSSEFSFSFYHQYDFNKTEEYGDRVPIGKPLNNIKITLFDACHHSTDLVGELGIYLDEKFTYYKTGDIVRKLPNGDFEYLTRKDTQIKIRGFRIEVKHIESTIEKYNGIGKAIVIAKENEQRNLYGLDKFLVAFYTCKDKITKIDHFKLKSFLQNQLPDYMIPIFFINIEFVPMNAHGKLDRLFFSKYPLVLTENKNVLKAENEIEILVSTYWKEILGLNEVSVTTNFFELGGNSLLIAKLEVLLKKQLPFHFTIVDLFRFPTIRSFSQFLSSSKLNSSFNLDLNKKMKNFSMQASKYKKVRGSHVTK